MARLEAKTEVTGSVWKITTAVGQKLEAGETVMLIESMKMEIPVIAEDGGTVKEFRVAQGEAISEGQVVAILEG
ncbi:MAG: biotin/lipoyl-binding carrier protein [Betaproteobacteria bacterium]|nr:biotin/lipoyl-binding carrier protein [Betaproteobacteria bacterium]